MLCCQNHTSGRHFTPAQPVLAAISWHTENSGLSTIRRQSCAWNRQVNREQIKINWDSIAEPLDASSATPSKSFKRSKT